ncbi:MAG: hypothetical protein U0175_04020 [Caldilineaceae bacterium]
MTNYKMQRISIRSTTSVSRVSVLYTPYHCPQLQSFYVQSALAILMTLCVLLANLAIAKADNTANVGHVHTVLLSGNEVKDLPGAVLVGDGIVWSNVSNQTIVIERTSGFRLFLPLLQTENKSSSAEPSLEQGTDKGSNLLGESASAWIIEAGESITMEFDQPNFYTFKFDGTATQQWQIVVNAE